MTYSLARTTTKLDLPSFARAARMHPELVRRWLALGLLEFTPDAAGEPWFGVDQLLMVARIKRLRAAFGLNYAAVGLVVDLLDRITELETSLRSRTPISAGRDNLGGR